MNSVMRELKLRGPVKQTLVIAPNGLVTQWIGEIWLPFQKRNCILNIYLLYYYITGGVTLCPRQKCSISGFQREW